MANVRNPPKRIYLIVGDLDRDCDFSELSEVTWCVDDIDHGIEYRLAAELTASQQARHAAECNLEAAHAAVVRMREELNWLRDWRTKDHESIDCCIQHALGEAETCTVCHPHGNAALAGGNGDERHG